MALVDAVLGYSMGRPSGPLTTISSLGRWLQAAAGSSRMGGAADIGLVAQAYRVFYEKVPTSSGYTMNHTATVYLMDSKGVLASTMNHQETEAVQRQKLRRLLAR